MNRHGNLLTGMMVSVLAAVFICSGCRDRAGLQGGPAAARKKPTPEESFQLIFETFRRGIDTGANGVSGSFVTNEASGRTRLTVNNSVTKELIPPTSADEPYRAKIIVTSRSAYSLTRSDDDDDDHEKETQKEERSGLDPLNPTNPPSEINVLDPELISSSKGGSSERDEKITDPVSRRKDEEVRAYELIYKNGRWQLLTKLDQETEQAIQSAFNAAFKTQI